jgi:hypothetical protein
MASKDISQTHIGDVELNHHLQRQILLKFLHNDKRPYSQILIDGMSGNSFLYHLKALLREKLISKTLDQTYSITPLGKLVLDSIAFDSSRFLLRPTIGLFLLARHSESNKYMLYESARQPFIGQTGFLFGKMPIGQSYEALCEYMTSRRNISSYKVEKSTPINMIYRVSGEVISHRTGVLMEISVDSIQSDRRTDAGTTIWRELDDPSLALLPEVKEVVSGGFNGTIDLNFDLIV